VWSSPACTAVSPPTGATSRRRHSRSTGARRAPADPGDRRVGGTELFPGPTPPGSRRGKSPCCRLPHRPAARSRCGGAVAGGCLFAVPGWGNGRTGSAVVESDTRRSPALASHCPRVWWSAASPFIPGRIHEPFHRTAWRHTERRA
jgi:hypothetical protein